MHTWSWRRKLTRVDDMMHAHTRVLLEAVLMSRRTCLVSYSTNRSPSAACPAPTYTCSSPSATASPSVYLLICVVAVVFSHYLFISSLLICCLGVKMAPVSREKEVVSQGWRMEVMSASWESLWWLQTEISLLIRTLWKGNTLQLCASF